MNENNFCRLNDLCGVLTIDPIEKHKTKDLKINTNIIESLTDINCKVAALLKNISVHVT